MIFKTTFYLHVAQLNNCNPLRRKTGYRFDESINYVLIILLTVDL